MNDLIIKAALALLANRPKPALYFLERHFGKRPIKFPIVRTTFPIFRHGCVEMAMRFYLAQKGVRSKAIGVASTHGEGHISDLINLDTADEHREGPIQYFDVQLGDGSDLSCGHRVLYLIRDNGRRFAVLITYTRYEENVGVEVISEHRNVGENFLSYLRPAVDHHSIYKGKVLSMKDVQNDEWALSFHHVPRVEAEQLILPDDVRKEIECQTIRFSHHCELLRARGRHLKRGVLFYGPPGTGKSLTIMYLLANMPGRTAIVVNSTGTKHLQESCELARALAPSTVIIDDVDLVATKRKGHQENPLLFELLNQMDGVAEDADVLFLLTTNRPETLEPALASRPGRVDQAIMIPLPDTDCRQRLFQLYSIGLPMAVDDIAGLVAKTDGVNAAFIRELFRKAALIAAEVSPEQPILDSHMEQALELLRRNPLTGKLLGYNSMPKPQESLSAKR